ncbi:hypothetical protein BH09DEP1_BH09DEP1_5910 [soil metagenome]
MSSPILITSIAFLSLLAAPSLANQPALTLGNLNTLTLCPTATAAGQKSKSIADWFEVMKKKSIPTQGIALVPTCNLSKLWEFKKGIPTNQNQPIFIHSSPRGDFKGRLLHGRNGQSFRCTSAWLKNSIVNGTFVTFDYFFDSKDLDFGQGINVDALKKIYDEIHINNPQAPLVLAATCIGAKIALEFAVKHNPQHIKAMVLESPFIDIKRVVYNIGKNHISWLPFLSNSSRGNLIKSIIEWYAPNCKASIDTPHAKLENINPKIPLFIAHLKNDSHYTDQEMHQMLTDLRKSGNQDIYVLVLKDSKTNHGHLNQKKEFAQASNAFLAQYGLPHDKQLAKEGSALLADAKYNAQVPSPNNWRIVASEKVG